MITSFTAPLTKNELQSLDHFLRHRGLQSNLSLTYAHGFLAAVLTAPALPHTDYYSLLKEDEGNKPPLSNGDEYNADLARLAQQINADLQQNTLTPLLFDRQPIPYKEASWDLIKTWCLGYLRGVGLDPVWAKDKDAMTMVMPMGILADEFDLVGMTDASGQPITDNLPHKVLARKELLSVLNHLYHYWKKQRLSPNQTAKPL